MNEDRRYSTREVERIIHATERLQGILNFMLSDNSSQLYLKWLAERPDLPATTDTAVVGGTSDVESRAARSEG